MQLGPGGLGITEEYGTSDEDFTRWMQAVDNNIALRTLGLDSSCLPDWTYRDAFDDGYRPHEAAEEAIKAAYEYG